MIEQKQFMPPTQTMRFIDGEWFTDTETDQEYQARVTREAMELVFKSLDDETEDMRALERTANDQEGEHIAQLARKLFLLLYEELFEAWSLKYAFDAGRGLIEASPFRTERIGRI